MCFLHSLGEKNGVGSTDVLQCLIFALVRSWNRRLQIDRLLNELFLLYEQVDISCILLYCIIWSQFYVTTTARKISKDSPPRPTSVLIVFMTFSNPVILYCCRCFCPLLNCVCVNSDTIIRCMRGENTRTNKCFLVFLVFIFFRTKSSLSLPPPPLPLSLSLSVPTPLLVLSTHPSV